MRASRVLVQSLLVCAIFLLSVSWVWAQTAPVASINLSGTIAVTNSFQSIQGKANNRLGCTIQNPSTNSHNQLVYFDSTNSANCSAATSGGSVTLPPGYSVNCVVNTINVLGDQVCITGTSGDPFFANFQ